MTDLIKGVLLGCGLKSYEIDGKTTLVEVLDVISDVWKNLSNDAQDAVAKELSGQS